LTDHLSYGDWQLAVLAYNRGRQQVKRALEATGSKHAWALVRTEAEEDKSYLARVHVAALTMAIPVLIECGRQIVLGGGEGATRAMKVRKRKHPCALDVLDFCANGSLRRSRDTADEDTCHESRADHHD
jgi:hypothetical protein